MHTDNCHKIYDEFQVPVIAFTGRKGDAQMEAAIQKRIDVASTLRVRMLPSLDLTAYQRNRQWESCHYPFRL
jgi:endonuclease V-like protein UPF0215 family